MGVVPSRLVPREVKAKLLSLNCIVGTAAYRTLSITSFYSADSYFLRIFDEGTPRKPLRIPIDTLDLTFKREACIVRSTFRMLSMNRLLILIGVPALQISLALAQTAPDYGQCGGLGWTGPTTCESGYLLVSYHYRCGTEIQATAGPAWFPMRTIHNAFRVLALLAVHRLHLHLR